MTDVLVIGVGNPLRGDDGAGLEVARLVRAAHVPGVEVWEHGGEPAALIDRLEGAGSVYLVDAVRGGRPGSVQRFDATEEELADLPPAATSHHVGLGEAIELTRALGRLPERLVVFGITGRDFSVGAGLTRAVARAVRSVAGKIVAEVERPAPRARGRA